MDLLTSSEKSYITGDLIDLFDTQKRTILIHKQPTQTIANTASNDILYGYGEPSNQVNYQYTPISGYYEAVVRYAKDQKQQTFQEIKVALPQGSCRIKVLESGKEYISNGVTESVEIDGIKFNIITDDGVKNHFDSLKFYYFILQRTN